MVFRMKFLLTAGEPGRLCEPWSQCLGLKCDLVCHVSFARSATNTGGGHWSHWQYRSWTDCGRGVPQAGRWLMFLRKLRVYHEVTASYLDKSGLKAIGTRWVYTNKGDAVNPFIRARLVAQETKRVSELTPEDPSSTFAATLPTGKPQGDAQSMHDWQAANTC